MLIPYLFSHISLLYPLGVSQHHRKCQAFLKHEAEANQRRKTTVASNKIRRTKLRVTLPFTTRLPFTTSLSVGYDGIPYALSEARFILFKHATSITPATTYSGSVTRSTLIHTQILCCALPLTKKVLNPTGMREFLASIMLTFRLIIR